MSSSSASRNHSGFADNLALNGDGLFDRRPGATPDMPSGVVGNLQSGSPDAGGGR